MIFVSIQFSNILYLFVHFICYAVKSFYSILFHTKKAWLLALAIITCRKTQNPTLPL